MDYIPFQFFVSVPKNEESDIGWEAIMIYSNYYNLGYSGSIVTFFFRTENDNLCRSLKKMWQKNVKSQDQKEANITGVKRLFNDSEEIKIVLKNVIIIEQPIVDTIGYAYVTPVPDVIGARIA